MSTLYVVATPIGNLGDFSPRGVEVLRQVGLIAAEDTRVTRKLLSAYQIDTPLTSCHEHNQAQKAGQLAERMAVEQMDMALVTDAGTPCISDPGYMLVDAALRRGCQVIPVPGACAAVAALSVCGRSVREFAFYGFLQRDKKGLQEKLLEMAAGVQVAVVHESPHRVVGLLEVLQEVLPDTLVSASADLTKLHEKTLRGSPQSVAEAIAADPYGEKREYCLVLDFTKVPRAQEETASLSPEAQLVDAMVQGMTLREAVEHLAQQGVRKNLLKSAALRLKTLLQEKDE